MGAHEAQPGGIELFDLLRHFLGQRHPDPSVAALHAAGHGAWEALGDGLVLIDVVGAARGVARLHAVEEGVRRGGFEGKITSTYSTSNMLRCQILVPLMIDFFKHFQSGT